MKTTKLLLIGIVFVLVGCGGSSYVAQDIFLVNQGFEKLSNSNYLEAESYLRAALAETNRSYQKETPPFPPPCLRRAPRRALGEIFGHKNTARKLPEVTHSLDLIDMFDHFDLMASIYDRLIGPPNTGRLRQLLKLPTNGWLLDAGGGTGRVSSRLNDLVANIVVSDLSLRMLKKAREKTISPVRAHVEHLPFPDESFDRVLVVDALHHFCDQQEAVEDLLRVLKPGGRLVIEEPDFNHKGVKLLALAEKILLMRSHFYAPEQIRDMIASYGYPAKIENDDRYTSWVVTDK